MRVIQVDYDIIDEAKVIFIQLIDKIKYSKDKNQLIYIFKNLVNPIFI